MNYKELLFNKDKVLSFYPELAVILNKYDEILAEEEFKNGKTNKKGNKRRAGTLGLNEAIIINQISYWNEINKKAGHNFKDGYYWTYNTYEKWSKNDFPYWSADTIRKSITALENMGIIISTDKYNSYKIDNTKWYRVDYDKLQKIIDIVEESEKQLTQEENESSDCVSESFIDGLFGYHKPIPEISTENTNRVYIQETTNSFSNEKDNSQEAWESNNSHIRECESHISMSLGVKQKKIKETPLKDMPTRAKEIADKLVDRTELSDGVYDCIKYFLEKYKAKNRKEHLPLRNDTLQRVVETMLSSITVPHYENLENKFQTIFYPLVCFMSDWEDRKEVIDRYFETEFNYIDEDENGKEKKIEVDYSLVHFTYADVITHIMQKCHIGADIEWYESEHVN